ncbi:PREDICTED: uncharacterized protein LOC102004834 [Chinchilla lanigera]|uniref:uncharacterized protein LOC102004834 n=1 Tax=Chinchilla lanigera TaxID=34839 RepID=UPI00038E9A59|nr:PREDICTED: uncharacterized protein LOC102004834 [Chinchilla lanigera]XP_005386177.1 PREDICTED: uncharacterized protein LOC102004834 [Chinchilla lanigera]
MALGGNGSSLLGPPRSHGITADHEQHSLNPLRGFEDQGQRRRRQEQRGRRWAFRTGDSAKRRQDQGQRAEKQCLSHQRAFRTRGSTHTERQDPCRQSCCRDRGQRPPKIRTVSLAFRTWGQRPQKTKAGTVSEHRKESPGCLRKWEPAANSDAELSLFIYGQAPCLFPQDPAQRECPPDCQRRPGGPCGSWRSGSSSLSQKDHRSPWRRSAKP